MLLPVLSFRLAIIAPFEEEACEQGGHLERGSVCVVIGVLGVEVHLGRLYLGGETVVPYV